MASDEPLEISGQTLSERVGSAIEQIEARFPHFKVHRHALARDRVLYFVGWLPPSGQSPEDHAAQVRDRAEDFREATVLLVQTTMEWNPRLTSVGAFEDRLFVPIWSRQQIEKMDEPAVYRSYDAFSKLQMSARFTGGYWQLNNRSR